MESKTDSRATPDVRAVVKILVTDNHFIEMKNYLRLCHPLGLYPIDYTQYQYAVDNGSMSIQDFLEKMMTMWISRSGKAATIETLSKAILEENYANLAENLQKTFNPTCKIQELININPQTSSSWIPSAVRFGLTTRSFDFIGRDDDLKNLTTSLMNHKLVVVTGIAGTGKTELCRKYSEQFCLQEDGNCLWFHGERDDTLLSSLIQLASQLGIGITPNASVLSYIPGLLLNVTFLYKKTLIIINNVNKCTPLVGSIIKEIMKIPLASILVTSTDAQTAAVLVGELFLLGPMNPVDAGKLVKHSLGAATSDSDVQLLLEIVHNFPLHLQQAVRYIKNKSYTLCGGFSVRDYVQLCQRKSITVEGWDVSIDSIMNDPENGEIAMKLLILLSYLNPDGVKDELLLLLLKEVDLMETCNTDEVGYQVIYDTITAEKKAPLSLELFESTAKPRKALDLLHRYLLIKCTDSVLTMHRLIQEAVRHKVHNREIFYRKVDDNPSDDGNDHLDFLRKLTGYLAKTTLADGSLRPEIIHFFYTWEFANAGQALENELKPLPMFICKTLLDICSNVGHEEFIEPNILNTSSPTSEKQQKIIQALKDEDCFSEFIRVLKITFEATKVVMEKDEDKVNPIVIGLLTSICLFHVGKVKDAETLRTETLKLTNSLFSKLDKSFLTNRHASLWSFQDILNWRRNQSRVLKILEQQTPETQNLGHNLGVCLLGMGRFVEAKIMLKTAANWKCDNLEDGDHHPSTLNTRRLLFYCMTQIDQQRWVGLEELEKLAIQQERLFGVENTRVVATNDVLNVVKEIRFQRSLEGSDDGTEGFASYIDKLYCPCSIV